jgi:hypothetical protein
MGMIADTLAAQSGIQIEVFDKICVQRRSPLVGDRVVVLLWTTQMSN